jgi:hypothetical protein
MTFSQSQQAAIRRAFDSVLAGLGPSRDLGDLLTDSQALRVASPDSGPARGPLVALAIAAAIIVGVGVMVFLGSGDLPTPGDVGTSLGPDLSVPIVSVPSSTTSTTSTTTAQDQEESRRATLELMACMIGTWDFDLAAYQAELQEFLDPEGDDIVVTVESGSGLLVIGPESMRFTLTYTDLVIGLEYPSGSGIVVDEIRVNGEVRSTFRLNRTAFLPGPIDDPVLTILRTTLTPSQGTMPDAQATFPDASLRLGTPGATAASSASITLECSGTRLVVTDRNEADSVTGDGPSAIWRRRQG